MNSWDNLRFLLAMRTHGTMSGAARMLGTNVATVSRRIDKLNEVLGIPALLKRPDRWDVNPKLGPILALVEEFHESLEREMNALHAGSSSSIISRLTIGCPPTISSRILLPGLAPEHGPPENVGFSFSTRAFEEGMGDNDIVVRVGRPESGRIITRLAGRLPFRIYTHREAPHSTEWAGLLQRYDRYPPMEMAQKTFGGQPIMRVEHFENLLDVVHSMKIPAPLPDVSAATDPDLVPHPDGQIYWGEYWLLYHSTRRNDPVVRETADWIVRCFKSASAPGAMEDVA